METTKNQQAILDNTSLSEEQQVEKLIEDKVETKEQSLDAAEIASNMFGLYHVRAKQLIESLSGNAVRRVFKKVLFEPLEDTNQKLQSKQENDLYQMVDEMFTSKYMLMIGTQFEALLQQKETVENALQEANEPVESSN